MPPPSVHCQGFGIPSFPVTATNFRRCASDFNSLRVVDQVPHTQHDRGAFQTDAPKRPVRTQLVRHGPECVFDANSNFRPCLVFQFFGFGERLVLLRLVQDAVLKFKSFDFLVERRGHVSLVGIHRRRTGRQQQLRHLDVVHVRRRHQISANELVFLIHVDVVLVTEIGVYDKICRHLGT